MLPAEWMQENAGLRLEKWPQWSTGAGPSLGSRWSRERCSRVSAPFFLTDAPPTSKDGGPGGSTSLGPTSPVTPDQTDSEELTVDRNWTHSESGAFFDDGGQLRQADVHGQVPRLPVDVKSYR